jgi:t-SNARE complex subunit (syntaxin)
MYQTLNQIVDQQGDTMNKIEENILVSKSNTKKTVQELAKALNAEKSIRERIFGCDFGMMCLSIWFIVAVLFLMIDL